jgi:hypothetical protein
VATNDIAKSLAIFDTWANNVMKMARKSPPTTNFNESSQSSKIEHQEKSISIPPIDTVISPMERVITSLTLESIERYIHNKGFMDRAQSMLTGVQAPYIFIGEFEESIELSGKVTSPSANTCEVKVSMNRNQDGQYELVEGYCPCLLGKTRGKCKHCGALLLYILSNPTSIKMKTSAVFQTKPTFLGTSSTQNTSDYSSQSGQFSSSKKRSYDEDSSSDNSSKKRASHNQQDSVEPVSNRGGGG